MDEKEEIVVHFRGESLSLADERIRRSLSDVFSCGGTDGFAAHRCTAEEYNHGSGRNRRLLFNEYGLCRGCSLYWQ